MTIDLPQPSPLPSARPVATLALRAAALPALLAVVLLGCGGSSVEQPDEPAGCSSDAECERGRQCVEAACVPPGLAPPASAGFFGCSVIRCPQSEPSCCVGVDASATGNESQGYAVRNEMVVSATAFPGEVRADFSFDAPDQQGWVTFRFGAELDLDWLDFTGRHEGVADRFLTVNTNITADRGCAFGFQLAPRQPPVGDGPFVFGSTVPFNANDFCYGRTRPGRARELAFAIFSTEPGDASLVISNITLRD